MAMQECTRDPTHRAFTPQTPACQPLFVPSPALPDSTALNLKPLTLSMPISPAPPGNTARCPRLVPLSCTGPCRRASPPPPSARTCMGGANVDSTHDVSRLHSHCTTCWWGRQPTLSCDTMRSWRTWQCTGASWTEAVASRQCTLCLKCTADIWCCRSTCSCCSCEWHTRCYGARHCRP